MNIKNTIDKTIANITNGMDTLVEYTESLFAKTDHSLNASFDNPQKYLSRNHHGFCVDGKRFITLKQSRSNMAVIAPCGKGKTQVNIFPFLLNATGHSSMIVNDVSGELSQTIPYLESQGIQTHILDFGKQTGLYFNPLEGCQGNITQIKKVAKILVKATSSNNSKNDFWSISAEDTLVLFIQYLLESEDPAYHNLGNTYRLLQEYQGSPDKVETRFAQKASPAVWSKFKALAGTSENTRKSIIATTLTALSFIGDNPTLCDITSHSNIDFQSLRESPQALFVQIPVSDAQFYAPMLSLFFQEFYRFAFAKLPSPEDLDIMMVLDEFDTLTAISDFSTIISNSRKFNIPQLLVLQSEAQLNKYGEQAKTILNNCNIKCYYGGLGDETYQLEKILGKYEYQPNKDNPHFTKERSLMTASEIREMNHEILVLPSGEKPLKVKITESYKQKKLMQRLTMPPEPKEEENTLHQPIQYLIIKTNDKPSR